MLSASTNKPTTVCYIPTKDVKLERGSLNDNAKKGYVTVTPNSNSTTGYDVTINIGDGTYVIEDKGLSNATAESNPKVPQYDSKIQTTPCDFYKES